MPPAVEPRLQAPSRAARWAPARVGSGTSSALGAAAPEPKAPEPEPLSDKAQHLLSSGKEVWAATVSQRTVLFEHVRNVNWGVKQPDIVAKLINLQDTDTVDAWHKNPALPKILVRVEEGEIYVSGAFLQAHCKKLSLEMSPRSQRERPLPAKAEDAKPAEDVEMADAQPADDKQPAEDVEMPDAKPAEEADDKPAEAAPAAQPAAEQEPDKRTRPELSDQDRAQVKSILSSGEVVWAAAKESDRTVLFQQIRRASSLGQSAPGLVVKLINPERDEELVGVWCEAEDVEPADAEDAKPAELHQEPAEQAEPAEAKPAEAEDDKPAEVEPAAEADAKPAEEADAEPAAVADAPAPEDDFETLHDLRMRRVEGDLYQLAARTLDEFEVAEKILRSRLKDKTFAEYKMKRGDKGWTTELFEVNWTTGKLWLPKGRRSVLAEEAIVRVRL
ncbi:unnamed protein product, partial [Symbiodinium sp. KB8]